MIKINYSYFLRIILVFLIFFLPCSSTFANNSDEKDDFIMGHVADSYIWHFATIGDLHLTLSLPVLVYSHENGFELFSSSRFYDKHHNKISYNSYKLNSDDKIISLDNKVFYDISMTKNVIAIFISAAIMLVLFIKIANNYSDTLAPSGFSAFIDQMICYIRDEIVRPNISGPQYNKFMPYLLTVFFFI